MTYIGIDYGTKRVGVAVSDDGETLAFPLKVINNSSRLVMDLKKIADEKEVKCFVIGESKDYKGNDNIVMGDIRALKNELEKEGFIVMFEPEFMSSVEATHLQGENEMIDASAAAIILQSFLNKRYNGTAKSHGKDHI